MSLLVKHWWGWVRHITRPVNGALQPYLDRYTLRRQRASGTNPWRLYLHHFLAADMPGHHNHPSTWSFSIVLWGSYTEETLVPSPVALCTYRHSVRWFNWIPASKYHRITELHPGRVPWAPWRRCRGTWTLFICGPLTGKGWGFWLPGRGHVDHTAMEHTRVVEK